MRINSDIIRWNQQGNRTIKTKVPAAPGDKYVGLVMLFSTVNGEPLAIFPDGVVQRMRVASSSALAARYLAREDSSTLALFGSGWQAGSHLPAMCAVRPITRVNVFSPTKANREAFVKEMQPKVSAEVRAVESPAEAIRDADIIATTTNSLTRVASADWVKPGLHLTCVPRINMPRRIISPVSERMVFRLMTQSISSRRVRPTRTRSTSSTLSGFQRRR
jgi:ornithine cyclodeaminase/alanine dehydrogenase-like protein (mu-crystallin family)